MKAEVGQYLYLDPPPMMTCVTELLATKLYRKLLSASTRPLCVIEVRPTAVMIGEDGIRNNGAGDRPMEARAVKETPTEDNKTQTDEKDAK